MQWRLAKKQIQKNPGGKEDLQPSKKNKKSPNKRKLVPADVAGQDSESDRKRKERKKSNKKN